jgi:hypothetical protein
MDHRSDKSLGEVKMSLDAVQDESWRTRKLDEAI